MIAAQVSLFQERYSLYRKSFYESIGNITHHDQFVNDTQQMVKVYLDVIKENGWIYDDFLISDITFSLKLNGNIYSEHLLFFEEFPLNFNSLYFKPSLEKLAFFLELYYNQKPKKDITEYLIEIGNEYLLLNTYGLHTQLLDAIAYNSNSICLTLIDQIISSMDKEFVLKDYTYTIEVILTEIPTRESYLIAKKCGEHSSPLVREISEYVLKQFRHENLVDGQGNWMGS